MNHVRLQSFPIRVARRATNVRRPCAERREREFNGVNRGFTPLDPRRPNCARQKPSPSRDRERRLGTGRGLTGFTLLEVIVATIIFTLVVAAAYALFDSARTMADRTEFDAAMQQEARVVLDTLRADLQGTCGSGTVYDTGFTGTQAGGDDTPRYTLDVVSVNNVTTRATAPEIDLTRTTYSIDEESSTEQKGLVRRKTKQLTTLTTVIREDEGLDEIGPNVQYVKFRYFDGSSWSEVWDSTRSKKLPWAVEATIHLKGDWKGQEMTEKYVARIYLPVAAETPEKKQ